MKKLLALCVVAASASSVFAQIGEPSAASQKYHAYRTAITEPSYGLAKVKGLVKKIKRDQEDNLRMPDKSYDALSFEQKFTYAMIHGEAFSQNCDAMPPIEDENKKIFAYCPGAFGDEANWSQRQRGFLIKNRGKVIGLIRSTMHSRRRVGVNLKRAIVETNARELIPDLVAAYDSDRRDHDILTVLMLLMKEGKYRPFLASASYKKLYADDASYKAYLSVNSDNRKLIVDRATAYYKSTRK